MSAINLHVIIKKAIEQWRKAKEASNLQRRLVFLHTLLFIIYYLRYKLLGKLLCFVLA